MSMVKCRGFDRGGGSLAAAASLVRRLPWPQGAGDCYSLTLAQRVLEKAPGDPVNQEAWTGL